MARRGGPTRAPRPRPLYASNEPVLQEHVQGDPEFVHVPEPPFRRVERIAFGKRFSVPVLDPREQMASLRDRGIGPHEACCVARHQALRRPMDAYEQEFRERCKAAREEGWESTAGQEGAHADQRAERHSPSTHP